MNPSRYQVIDYKENYTNISQIKLLMSFIIVIFHYRPFQNVYPHLDYFINSGLGRICVPFFFFSSGYFVAKKEGKYPEYILNYNKRNIKTYLIWSCIYFPLLISYFYDNYHYYRIFIEDLGILNYPFLLGPLLLVLILSILILYSGVYYHLWFYPALIFSVNIVSSWHRKRNLKALLILSFFLLLFGSTETYWGFLSLETKSIFKIYYDIFITSRNFLFFGLFYVCFGYYCYHRGSKTEISSDLKITLLISILLFTFDLYLIMDSDRLDSNILLSIVPLTYSIFFTALRPRPFITSINNQLILSYSKYIYLIHPFVIFIFKDITKNNWINLLITYSVCFNFSKVAIKTKDKKRNKQTTT